ncbi:MAG TPA: hypothetical protein VF528_17315 [Pyrinomonadaceae bacterium]|jgi:hypothetical protein
MSEQRDNTTERDEPAQKEHEPQPGSYYYDDATGYEFYDPAQDDEEEDEPPSNE